MIPLLLGLLTLLAPARAGSQAMQIQVAVAADLEAALPAEEAIASTLGRAFQEHYGRFVDPAARATVSLERAGGGIGVLTEITSGSSRRSLRSTVPMDSPGVIVPVIAGDLAFLQLSLKFFSGIALGPPPALAAALRTDILGQLTGWTRDELEPVGLAGTADGVVICFPHRWLTLGPSFSLLTRTMQDLEAQGSGPERLLLSGIAAGKAGELYLLSERQSKIARMSPSLGTRRLIDAPGLSALGGTGIDGGVAVLSGKQGAAGLSLFTSSGSRTIPLGAEYASAAAADAENDLWVWDAAERRIRIVSPRGREIHSIKPLFPASAMELPQQMVVLDDDSFLLGGSGEVWKFDSAGIPSWRLTRTGGRPGERLPASFLLAHVGSGDSFVLLDLPSRRLLQFVGSKALDDPDSMPSLLARLDTRKTQDLQEGSARASEAGLCLVALQLAGELVHQGGPAEIRDSALTSLMREEAFLSESSADALAARLVYDQAEKALRRAVELTRVLVTRDPDDADEAARLHSLLDKLQGVHDAVVHETDLEVSAGQPRFQSADGWHDTLVLPVSVRNGGSAPMEGIRIEIAVPGISLSPAAASPGSLQPGALSRAEIRLDIAAIAAGERQRPPGTARALLGWRSGDTATEKALTIPFPGNDGEAGGRTDIPARSTARDLFDFLAFSAQPGDPLIMESVEPYLTGAAGNGDRLAALFGILDDLDALRALAAAQRTRSPGVQPEDPRLSARDTLRTLGSDDRGWVSLILSLSAALDVPEGLLVWPDSAFALVETDIPLPDALAAEPALAPYGLVLKKLSRDGRLCLPISAGEASAPGQHGAGSGRRAAAVPHPGPGRRHSPVARSGGARRARRAGAALPAPPLAPVYPVAAFA